MSHSCDDQSRVEISTILFDYGGVLAEEGFRDGLLEIARSSGLRDQQFFDMAADSVYETGYVTGDASEGYFWDVVRKRSGIGMSDEVMRKHIISRFVLRPEMLSLVKLLRQKRFKVMVLSDQTNWLKELDERDGFFREFDQVFNSYDLGKGKKDVTLFSDILNKLGVEPQHVLFVDDNAGHTNRAQTVGLKTITFKDVPSLLDELRSMTLITESELSNL